MRKKGILTMGKSPKEVEEKLNRVLTSWSTHADKKSFGGMTLAEFKAAVAPSQQHRTRINELNEELNEETIARDHADEVTVNLIRQVVAGVLADPTEGPDSATYEGMGYTRDSERKSGLTRKHKEPDKK